jgi:hypothetical protein
MRTTRFSVTHTIRYDVNEHIVIPSYTEKPQTIF